MSAGTKPRPFWAQTIALCLLGLLIGLIASVVTTAFTVIGVSLASDPAPLAADDIIAAGVGATIYTMIAAAVGGGIGTLARNQVASAISVLVYLSTVDPLLAMALPSFGQFGPIALGIATSGASPDSSGGPGAQLLAPFVAGAVWLAYAAALQVAAFLNARRQEVP